MTFDLPTLLRGALLCVPLVGFLVHANRDNSFHFKGRKVPKLEHLLHLLIFVALLGLVPAAFRGDLLRLRIFGGAFVVLGGCDELVYHHDLPPEEVDWHAKEHFFLLCFVVLAWALP